MEHILFINRYGRLWHLYIDIHNYESPLLCKPPKNIFNCYSRGILVERSYLTKMLYANLVTYEVLT